MSEQQNDVSGSSGKRAGRSPRQQALRASLRSKRFWLLIAALALANWFLVSTLFPSSSDRITISYTAFREQVEADYLLQIVIIVRRPCDGEQGLVRVAAVGKGHRG